MINLVASAIISWIVILIVGFIKDFDIFAKISKENRKPIYLAIDCILGCGLSALYYVIFKIPFDNYLLFCRDTVPAILALYAVYEQTKFRDLVKIAKEKLISVIGKNVIDKKVKEIIEVKADGENKEQSNM